MIGVISNRPLDFGVDPDPDQGILTDFLPIWDRDNCRNFVGSTALAEVCGLRVLLAVELYEETGCMFSSVQLRFLHSAPKSRTS